MAAVLAENGGKCHGEWNQHIGKDILYMVSFLTDIHASPARKQDFPCAAISSSKHGLSSSSSMGRKSGSSPLSWGSTSSLSKGRCQGEFSWVGTGKSRIKGLILAVSKTFEHRKKKQKGLKYDQLVAL